jgi:cobalt-zinc-cadmium efflux system outer membrane protein
MSRFTHSRAPVRLLWTASAVLAFSLGSVAISHAQPISNPPLTLPLAFAQAWERQPEAATLLQRRQASESLRQAASSWTPAPAALEASVRSDRFNRRQGAQEVEFGVAVPLWLPGERERSQALADAQLDAVGRQALLAQWQLAQSLREHWWTLLREREDLRAALERLQSMQALASDVARRVKAGELSRADQHQADAAVLLAVAEQTQTQSRVIASEQALRALLGLRAEEALLMATSPEPEPAADAPAHPLLGALEAKALTARSAAALARAQVRASPELTLLHTRDRSVRGETSNGTVTLGLRFPLGSSDRNKAAVLSAGADQTEAEVLLARERERLVAEQRSAQAALAAARAVLSAAQDRARLADETRQFFDKSFRLGETDLPTRLRVELEAGQAQRDLARARIDLSLAIATLRQRLGLLPE